MEDLGRTFQSMPFWQAQPYANMLGIDEKTLLAMQSGQYNKWLDDYNERLKSVGLNADEAAKSGNEFSTAVRVMSAEATIAGETLMDGKFGKALTWVVEKAAQVAHGVSLVFGNNKEDLVDDALKGFASWGVGYSTKDAPTGKGQDTAWNRVVQHFQANGFTPAQAVGLAAGFKGESNSFDPAAKGDYVDGKATAYGIGQWHAPRWKDFEKVMHKSIFGSSLDDQLAFADWELKNSEWKAAAGIHDAHSAREAAERSVDYFRPADRIGAARLRGDMAATAASSVVVNQTTTINANGPGVKGSDIASHQNDVNNTLVRNVQGAVR